MARLGHRSGKGHIYFRNKGVTAWSSCLAGASESAFFIPSSSLFHFTSSSIHPFVIPLDIAFLTTTNVTQDRQSQNGYASSDRHFDGSSFFFVLPR